MAETQITCPKCGFAFEPTAAMSAKIETAIKAKYEADAARARDVLAAKERALEAKSAEVERAQSSVDSIVAEKLAGEKSKLVDHVKAMARQEATTEIILLKDQLADQNRKLTAAAQKEAELARQARELDDAKRAVELERKAGEAKVARAQAEVDAVVAERLKSERTVIAAEEGTKARLTLESDLSGKDTQIVELMATIRQLNDKLTTAQQSEAESRRKQRELDDKLREADLTIETKVGEQVSAARAKAREEADEAARLRMMEKDKIITDMQKQVEEMKRKAEQGSQQLQGEVQELDLERQLSEAFPRDTIEPVPKGQHGGDAIHRVVSASGQLCGSLLWEAKRTKNWASHWTDKLKQDQLAAKADLAIIVTRAMPAGLESFGEVDGIWVTTPALAIPLAAALRMAVTEAAIARRASDGQQGKMEILYQYLTGPQFRHRLEAIKDAFTTMQEDLDAEKRVITKQWAKRQQQIERVMVSTVGMYGDFQAIAGKTLQEIEGWELHALDTSDQQSKGAS